MTGRLTGDAVAVWADASVTWADSRITWTGGNLDPGQETPDPTPARVTVLSPPARLVVRAFFPARLVVRAFGAKRWGGV